MLLYRKEDAVNNTVNIETKVIGKPECLIIVFNPKVNKSAASWALG